jgi:hypothetical protein
MVMATGIIVVAGIMTGSTATKDSMVAPAEAMNFTAATASMVVAVQSAVVAASTVAEVMEADTGNRSFFA